MPKVTETLHASLGKNEKTGKTDYVQVGIIREHSNGSRYITMDRLFNYSLLPGGDVKYFHLQVRDRNPYEEG